MTATFMRQEVTSVLLGYDEGTAYVMLQGGAFQPERPIVHMERYRQPFEFVWPPALREPCVIELTS